MDNLGVRAKLADRTFGHKSGLGDDLAMELVGARKFHWRWSGPEGAKLLQDLSQLSALGRYGS
jgi:hypothetical protein